MKKILTSAVLACSAVAAASPSAFAVDNSDKLGFYVGGAYGGFKSRGGDFDDENDYYEVLAGFKFNPYLGVEGAYANFGEYGGDFASAEVQGYGVALVGYLPLMDRVDLYAKAGKFFSTVDVEFAGFDDDFDDDQIYYGVGADFALSEPLTLSIEYDRYKVDVNDSEWPVELDDSDTDIDTVKVGLKFKF